MARPTIKWTNASVWLIDQTKLPQREVYITCRDVKSLWRAIRNLSVRGAPALGVAAAFGILLGLKNFKGKDPQKLMRHINKTATYLGTSRPTAVNLFNVLERMIKVAKDNRYRSVTEIKRRLTKEAMAIYEEDRKVCRRMGDLGSTLIRSGQNVLTVCNTGALATVDYGTALGVFTSAKKRGRKFHVYTCETRPLLQGARLTAWELLRGKIDTTLICDNMAASLMQRKKIDAVFTGADRIAANGDTANKIGTYNLAVLAKHHRVPFYVVAPTSTLDPKIKSGKKIPIEQRNREEVLGFAKLRTAPTRVKVYNPAFDVTPHRLITAIIMEQGIIRPPYRINLRKALERK
jgi:methylthioribose-1-phosphate isomerase